MRFSLPPVERSASGTSAPGILISAAVHLALVVAFLLEPRMRSDQTRFDEPLPEGLSFLVPPSSGPARTIATPRYRDRLGDAGEAEGTREGARTAPDAPSTGESASLAAGAEEVADASDRYADAFTDIDVDSAAVRHPDSAAPAYPPELMRLGVEGYVSLRFVVDTSGRVDPATVQVIEASRPEFARAVLAAIPGMKFTPARIGSIKVRQLAEQLFRFAIQRPTVPPSTAVRPVLR